MADIGDTDFGVQVGVGTLGRVVAYTVAFGGSILLARLLGPDDYGAFYLLLSIVAFLDNPMTGWAEACRKRLTEADFPSGEAIGSTLAGIVLASGVVLIVSWLAAPYLQRFVDASGAWWLLSILFVGMVAYHTANEVLKSTRRFGASPWVNAARDLFRVVAQAALVLGGFGVAGMVGGMVLANLLVAPVVFVLIGIRPSLPTSDAVRQIWSYARYSIPGGIVGTAQGRMDRILLGFLATTAVVGHYEVALKLTLPAMFVAGVAQDGLMGRISNLRSRGESFSRDVQNNLAHASVIGIPLFFGALTIGEPVIVTIYSNQYATAGAFFAGLALFRLLRTQKSILVATINGLDKPDLNLRISTGIFSLNLALGVALFFVVGPVGVVIATVISEVIAYGIRAYLVRSLVPSVRLLPRLLVEQIASGAIMAVVVLGLRVALPLSSWPVVVLVVVVGGLVYFGTLIAISYQFRATAFAIARDAGLSTGT